MTQRTQTKAPMIHMDYVGGSTPDEEGHYLVVNVVTTEQWPASIHKHEDGTMKVFSIHDMTCHEREDFAQPDFRWYKIRALDRDQCLVLAKNPEAITV